MIRSLAWGSMAVLALGVATYSLSVLVNPSLGAPFVRERLATMAVAVYLHLGASAVALATGPFQFLTSLRRSAVALHRWAGRVYLTAVMAGGLSGLPLATVSEGGLAAHLGFGMLACLWLVTSGAAYASIRRGDVARHRRWMTRSFALTFAAVTLRLYLPIGLAVGVSYEHAYPIVSWLCWVPNLLVAERWFVKPSAPAPRRRSVAAAA